MKYINTILFFLFFITTIHAQKPSKLDSLKKVLVHLPAEGKSFAGDTLRVRVLCEMGEEGSDIEKKITFLEDAKRISSHISFIKGEILSLNKLGITFQKYELFLKSLDAYFQLLRILEKQNSIVNTIAYGRILREIGVNYLWLKDYKNAYIFYERALKVFEKLDEKEEYADTLNDLARTYYNDNKYDQAISVLEKCLTYIPYIKGKLSEPSFYDNLGMVYGAKKNITKSFYFFKKSEKIYGSLGIKYYKNAARNYFMLAEMFYQNNEIENSLLYANRANEMYSNNNEKSFELFELLYKIHKQRKQNTLAMFFYEKFNSAKDSSISLSQKRKIEVIKAEYDLDNEQSKNLFLKEKLKNEAAKKMTMLVTLSISIIFLSIVLFGYFQLNKKNQIIEHQKSEIEKFNIELKSIVKDRTLELQSALKEVKTALYNGQTQERERVASELHDNLGSTISAIKWRFELLENQSLGNIDRNIYLGILEMLKSAYSEIRLISHHLMPETLKEYGIRVAILDFIKQINESNKIAINCDIENHFIIEDPKIELELYSISMELLNNILKHSNAQKAKISIKRLHTNYLLFITDDGKGFDAKSEGFGLKNIKLRVKEMNGKISIYSQNFETTFKIIIPII